MGLLEQKLNLKLTQKLTLTPALQQAIKLLQMTIPELKQEISDELISNPLLEDVASTEGEAEEQRESQQDTADDTLHSEELNLEEYFKNSVDDEYIPMTRSQRDFSESNDFSYENFLTKPISLYEHLDWQLQMNEHSEEVLSAARALLPYLDEDGYLRTPASEDESAAWLSEELGLSVMLVEHGILAIQDLDPVGVGARTLQECLRLQIKQLGFENDAILRTIIDNHLEDIANTNTSRICRLVDISDDELKLYIDFIRKLEPKPGRKYNNIQPHYIVPDVYVYKVGNDYQIQLNDDGLPHLRVNKSYTTLMGDSSHKLNPEQRETASYVKERLKSAVWIIRSIQNRQRTILKVAKSIVAYQRDFLDYGYEHMKPLTLKDVADDIGMHESTVARVVKNKYMHTPRGLFEIRFFFNTRISALNGNDVSSLAVKEKIRKIVETESPQKPYSDSGLVNILRAHGINIARRTVAKYREELAIASSSERKRMYRRTYEH